MTRICVVDDEPAIRQVVSEFLQDEGYEVESLGDGVGLLERLREAPEPLIVLVDLFMPHLDGADLLAACAADPLLGVRHRYIMMTGASWGRAPEVDALLLQLQVPVVEKPFLLETLLVAVQRAAVSLVAAAT